jgi:hypothetical protein
VVESRRDRGIGASLVVLIMLEGDVLNVVVVLDHSNSQDEITQECASKEQQFWYESTQYDIHDIHTIIGQMKEGQSAERFGGRFQLDVAVVER